MTTETDHIADEHWMQLALAQAQLARASGEVPVGAVVVRDGQCIATGHNAPISHSDPTAHAEINALRQAAQVLENYRLQGCTLYVTLEPCAMCAMAMLHARVDRVVFGAYDPKIGAAGSVVNLFASRQLNHHTQLTGGVLEPECSNVLKQFFQEKRQVLTIPLRDDALRTPAQQFSGFRLEEANWVSDLPALDGLRLHYHHGLPQSEDAKGTLLCVHDERGSSEQYAELLSQVPEGWAVLVPDLIGFGRSDKPKKTQWHTPECHARVLIQLLQATGPHSEIRVVLPSALSGLLPALQQQAPHLISIADIISRLPPLAEGVERAPFPDDGHRAGVRALHLWRSRDDFASHTFPLNFYDDLHIWLRQFEHRP
jgi:tRNA(adenine34) deaminase